MQALVVRRILLAVPTLFIVSFLAFGMIRLNPDAIVVARLGENYTPEQAEQVKADYGLDKPFYTEYFHWLGDVLTGNLGNSLASDQTVSSILADGLPTTFQLLAYALFISLALTVPIALLAARNPGGFVDRVGMITSMAGLSVANYVLAVVLVYVFAVQLGWLPAIYTNDTGTPGELIKSLTLPALSIGFPLFCFYTRLLRADVLEQMQGEDYVVTAKAKGVGPWRVLVRHALPNSLFGLLTIVALNIGTLIGATVIIEQIFAVPGIGHSLLEAINNRDVPVVEGIVLVLAVVVVICNLLADVLYAVLDPRIRYGRSTA